MGDCGGEKRIKYYLIKYKSVKPEGSMASYYEKGSCSSGERRGLGHMESTGDARHPGSVLVDGSPRLARAEGASAWGNHVVSCIVTPRNGRHCWTDDVNHAVWQKALLR